MDGWHFPRPALADHYIRLLGLGISSNLAIIAPRRKKKTLFVLQDLAPYTQKKKYLPVYASLWQNCWGRWHLVVVSGFIVSLSRASGRRRGHIRSAIYLLPHEWLLSAPTRSFS